jgi:hypothetical protein
MTSTQQYQKKTIFSICILDNVIEFRVVNARPAGAAIAARMKIDVSPRGPGSATSFCEVLNGRNSRKGG